MPIFTRNNTQPPETHTAVDIQHVMIFIPLDEKTLRLLRQMFTCIYYHPEFWDVFSWYHHDVEGCQKAFEAVPQREWDNVQMIFTGATLIPQLKDRKTQVPNLKWIQLRAVGADAIFRHEIFKNEPPFSDLKVVNVSGIPSSAIAQHVFMLILAVYRNLDQYILDRHQKMWKRPLDEFNCPDITTLTYGILGYGSIGREVARMARGWGAQKILACNSSGKRSWDLSFCPEGTGDPQGLIPSAWYNSRDPISFREFLSETDVLVISLPATPDTHHILNAETLSYLRSTSIIINVARGSLIDQAALVDALNSGRLKGAGLDVLEIEPPDRWEDNDNPNDIWTAQNCIVTPHVSYLAGQFWERTMEMIQMNKEKLARGDKMVNVLAWPK